MWSNVLTTHAIDRQHMAVVSEALSLIMRRSGLWDGEPRTKFSAAQKHGPRFTLEEHHSAEPITVVHFDGKRMCAIITSINLAGGGLKTSTRAAW